MRPDEVDKYEDAISNYLKEIANTNLIDPNAVDCFVRDFNGAIDITFYYYVSDDRDVKHICNDNVDYDYVNRKIRASKAEKRFPNNIAPFYYRGLVRGHTKVESRNKISLTVNDITFHNLNKRIAKFLKDAYTRKERAIKAILEYTPNNKDKVGKKPNANK